MKNSYALNAPAHAKIVLHACKFPTCSVNGALLGRLSGDIVEIVDAIPFFHTHIGLPLRLEIAFSQSDIYAKKQGLRVVGYYQASDHIATYSPDATARVVMDKISQEFSQACLLLVNNAEFRAPFNNCLSLFLGQGDHWTAARDDQLQLAQGRAEELVREKAFRSLADFEDHLKDPAADWKNTIIVA